MQVVIFLDLDDTFFQTARKCPGTSGLHPAAYARDGSPLSFMTEKQRAVFSFFQGGATLIPTTARNFNAFSRVALPFSDEAILDFGGVILNRRGEPDQEWDRLIRKKADAIKKELHELHRLISDFAGKKRLSVHSRIISDFDMDLYILVKHDGSSPEDLEILYHSARELIGDGGFQITYNDNNLSFIPGFINKASAVSYLSGVIGSRSKDGIVTIGMGDSMSDLPFMAGCDFSLMPGNSQVMNFIKGAQDVQRQL